MPAGVAPVPSAFGTMDPMARPATSPTRQFLSSLSAALLPLCLLCGCRKEAPPAPSGLQPSAVDSIGQELAKALSEAGHDPRLWKECKAEPALHGDLDGDGAPDATVRIHCSWKGPQSRNPHLSQGYTEIAVWVFPKSGGRFLGSLQAGGSDDEIVSMTLDSLAQGRLWLTMGKLAHGDSAGQPSLREQRTYRVEGRRFVAVP